jgi:hypothetical protein
MPRKPNQSYGYIAFGKDGTVKKNVSDLSTEKARQEEEVARMFADFLSEIEGQEVTCDPLPEDGHDFALVLEGGRIEVQLTEVAPAEYQTLVTSKQEEARFTEFVSGSGGRLYGIDVEKRDRLITERIQMKQDKHYQKPREGGLWLCIFSSDIALIPEVWHSGGSTKAKAIRFAEEYCEKNRAEPFDAVWFQPLGLRPYRIWPPMG